MENNGDVRTVLEFYWKRLEESCEETRNIFKVKTERGGEYIGEEVMNGNFKIIRYYFLEEYNDFIMFLYIGEDAKLDLLVEEYFGYYHTAVKNAYPMFVEALEHGLHENYSQYALTRFKDPKSEDIPFWCMIVKLENVNELSSTNPYIERKYVTLFNAIQDMLYQVRHKEMSKWDIIKANVRAFIDGCLFSRRVNKTVEEIMGE